MIFAITGGTGFIGRSLVSRALEAGDEVRVLSRRSAQEVLFPPGVQFHCSDLARSSAVNGELRGFLENADALVHCAGEVNDAGSMRALHVHGTQRLIDTGRGRIRRWVQLSSVGAYGAQRAGAVRENTPASPVGEYEVTKAEADGLVLMAAEEGAFETVVLRPSIVFGPSMPNQSLYQLVSLVERGWFGFVGAPGAMANYVFVDDVADALWECATSPNARGAYNLSDDRTMEVFVACIAKALGRPEPELRLPEAPLRMAAWILQLLPRSPLTVSRVDALTRRTTYPSARIEQELGFKFRVSVEEGLRRLVEDWRRRR